MDYYIPDLIRQGAEETGKVTGTMSRPSLDHKLIEKTCAIGAAGYAANGDVTALDRKLVNQISRHLDSIAYEEENGLTFWDKVTNKNDFEDCSRKAIAEWLESKLSREELTVSRDDPDPTETDDEEEGELVPA